MTWDELAQQIAEMPDFERSKTAFFRENYDEGAEMIPVQIVSATEDLSGANDECVMVWKGEFLLQ